MEKEIKKIAILHCKKSGRVCTGAACFRAFYDRKKSFEQYEGQPVELSAYFDCNGCEADKLNDPGFTEKTGTDERGTCRPNSYRKMLSGSV